MDFPGWTEEKEIRREVGVKVRMEVAGARLGGIGDGNWGWELIGIFGSWWAFQEERGRGGK